MYFLFLLVFIELLQKTVDVFLLQVIGRGKPQLVGIAAANADFVCLPHPALQIHTRDGRNVDCDDGAAQGWIGRSPGISAPLFHFIERIVGKLAVAALDARDTDLICKLDGSPQSPERWYVGTADALEALGTKFRDRPNLQ